MKQFLIDFLIALPFGFYFAWWMEGNYGKTTYGNFFNWLIRRKLK